MSSSYALIQKKYIETWIFIIPFILTIFPYSMLTVHLHERNFNVDKIGLFLSALYWGFTLILKWTVTVNFNVEEVKWQFWGSESLTEWSLSGLRMDVPKPWPDWTLTRSGLKMEGYHQNINFLQLFWILMHVRHLIMEMCIQYT